MSNNTQTHAQTNGAATAHAATHPAEDIPSGSLIQDSFTSSSIKVSVLLKPTATPAQAMHALDSICTALHDNEASTTHLRMLLGRVVAEVRNRRLYEPEHASFEQFTMAMTKKYHLSRMTIRKAVMMASNLPATLQPSEVEDIPLTNLELVAGAAKNAEPGKVKQMLRAAAGKNLIDFRELAEDKGWVARRGRPEGEGETGQGSVTLRISVSRKLARLFKERAGEDWSAYLARLMGVTASGRVMRQMAVAVGQARRAGGHSVTAGAAARTRAA